jgi:hypothetical protein
MPGKVIFLGVAFYNEGDTTSPLLKFLEVRAVCQITSPLKQKVKKN